MHLVADVGEEGGVLLELLLLLGSGLILGGEGGYMGGGGGEDCIDERHDLHHVFLHEAAGGYGGSADAYAGGLEGGAAVEGDHVLIHRDVGLAELFLGHATAHIGELGA